jgi:hypothetical protein
MPALAAAYVSELADGHVPAKDSPEAVAYREWSREDTVRTIVKESALKVYGPQYYLLGSLV